MCIVGKLRHRPTQCWVSLVIQSYIRVSVENSARNISQHKSSYKVLDHQWFQPGHIVSASKSFKVLTLVLRENSSKVRAIF